MKMTKKERWARGKDPFKGTAVDGSAENLAPVYFFTYSFHSMFEERLDL
jgi:hypothetical protein